MANEDEKQPAEVEEDALDEISGGADLRTGASPVDPAKAETDKKTFGPPHSMGWDNTKH